METHKKGWTQVRPFLLSASGSIKRLVPADPTLQSGLFGDKMSFHGFIQLAD
jgi:hypothetical protein